MGKSKAVCGLAVLIAMFAVSVTPAAAWFESTGKNGNTGKGKFGLTTFLAEYNMVECESAVAEWAIRTATKQELVRKGPHLNIRISASTATPPGWKKCKDITGNSLEVSECEFQIAQPTKGATAATLSVIKKCVGLLPGNCRITFPAIAENENLKEIELSNEGGSNSLAKVNVTGLTYEAESLGGVGCLGIIHLKNNTGEMKGELTGEEVRVV